MKSLKNICGDTGVYLPKVSKDFDWYTLILDPARSGCGKAVLDFLKDKSANLPASIVYVSCNLATLKRDLAQICHNYKITYVRGVDMFPNTKHIETIVCLQKQVWRFVIALKKWDECGKHSECFENINKITFIKN